MEIKNLSVKIDVVHNPIIVRGHRGEGDCQVICVTFQVETNNRPVGVVKTLKEDDFTSNFEQIWDAAKSEVLELISKE